MKEKSFLFIALIFSLVAHILIAFSFSLHIEAYSSPEIYGWPNNIHKNDLFFEQKKVGFPASEDFSLESIRRKYFSLPYPPHNSFVEKSGESSHFPLITPLLKTSPIGNIAKKAKNYFYVWDREPIFPAKASEVVPYRAYVSSYGKVMFLYPEKLPVDSYQNLNLLEYIKKSAIFLDDKFFWTKLEGGVQ